MSFSSEEQLQNAVLKRITQDFKIAFTNIGLNIYEEVPYNAGITDIVVYNVSQKYFAKRTDTFKLNSGIVVDAHLSLYLIFRNKEYLNIDDLVKKTRLSRAYTLKILKWLKHNGFVERNGEILEITYAFKRHVTNTCAFELKINNWKRALKQAYGAKSYSNIQFVILDDDYITPALENKNLFKQYNIGLASILPDSKIKRYYIPHKSNPYSEFGIWKFNELSFLSILKQKKEARC